MVGRLCFNRMYPTLWWKLFTQFPLFLFECMIAYYTQQNIEKALFGVCCQVKILHQKLVVSQIMAEMLQGSQLWVN